MAYDVGFNFRSTAGYVSDGAGQTYVLAADAFPLTRGVATANFGYETNPTDHLNNNNANDVRLAGVVYTVNPLVPIFRINLPSSGPVTVHIAMGEQGATQNHVKLVVKDASGNVLLTLPDQTVNADTFQDATNVNRSTANWPGNEVGLSVNLSGGNFLRFLLGTGNADGGFPVLSHIRVVQADLAFAGPSLSDQFSRIVKAA